MAEQTVDLAALVARIEALEKQIQELKNQQEVLEDYLDNKASDGHYHDEYANIDHVERSENSFTNQFSNLRNSLDNLEYRISDVDRKAERAQSAAENAARSARGGW